MHVRKTECGLVKKQKEKHFFFFSKNQPNLDEKEDGFQFMVEANKTSENISIIYLNIVGYYPLVTISTCIVSIIFCLMIKGNFDTAFLYHPYKFLYVDSFYTLLHMQKKKMENFIVQQKKNDFCFKITLGPNNPTRLLLWNGFHCHISWRIFAIERCILFDVHYDLCASWCIL